MNLNDNPRGGNFCLSKAGLKIGDGSALGFGTAAPNGAGVDYCIKGILYHHADSATDEPLDAAPAQGLLTTCLYAITFDAGGNFASVQGTPVLTADLVSGVNALEWPQPADGFCVIGYIKIETRLTYDFTPGTTALSATGVYDTYYDVCTAPVENLSA